MTAMVFVEKPRLVEVNIMSVGLSVTATDDEPVEGGGGGQEVSTPLRDC